MGKREYRWPSTRSTANAPLLFTSGVYSSRSTLCSEITLMATCSAHRASGAKTTGLIM